MFDCRSLLAGTIPCLVSLLLPACAAAPPPPSRPSALLHRAMPDFEGETLSGNHFYTAQGNGHPMIVTYFKSTSPECRPLLGAVQSVYGGSSDVVAVGISEDEAPGAVRRLVDSLGVHFPVIFDEGGRIAEQVQAPDLPVVFVVTAHGKVLWVGGADATEDAIGAAVHAAND